MPRHLILGTGTAIGKTFVTVALARALGRRGLQVAALKPVETGFPAAALQGPSVDPPNGTDAGALEGASSRVTPPRPHPRFAFAPPISPHLAARRAGVDLRVSDIASWLDNATAIHDTASHVLLETAGGVFSPLSDLETNFDLLAACAIDRAILVAPDALGVLHDVRSAVLAMTARGRPPDAVVLSASRPSDLSTGTNDAELRRLGLEQPIWQLRAGAPEDADPIADWLQGA